MVKDSLKKLLDMYPWFFDKSNGSNFYKSQDVTNRRFQELYQSLFDIHESFHLEKHCLIWKVQSVPYDYFIHFVANYQNLKSVKCYKNDSLIYIEEYLEEDNVDSFVYIYDSTDENGSLTSILNNIEDIDDEYEDDSDVLDENVEVLEDPIIPEDKFKIIIETYDELIITKGFPENDTILGDEFDHDISLDRIGKLNNIPRKNYIPTTDYANTEPPYNNRTTEDDYHYMNRIIEYNLKLNNTPLPVLEIWKLYGLDAVMLNRERLLFKWFDETKHPFDESTGHVLDWGPEKWEHKDGFCDWKQKLGTYFFVIPSTTYPRKWSDITFNFLLLNNLAEELDENFTVDIYKTGKSEALVEGWNKKEYLLTKDYLDDAVNEFRFIAYNKNMEQIADETIEITVKGCNNGDFYVSSNGDDILGDGTKENPFFSLTRALENITDIKNTVIVQGDVNIDDATIVNNSCDIIGCGNACIHFDLDNKFFHILGNKNLAFSLTDINLDSNGAITYFESSNYNNQNIGFDNYLTVLVHGGEPVLTIYTDKLSYFYYYDNIKLHGTFKSKEGNPIKNTNVIIKLANSSIIFTTDSYGQFSGVFPIRKLIGENYDILGIFNGNVTFLETSKAVNLEIIKPPIIINKSFGEDVTITATGYSEDEEVKFYRNGLLLTSENANANGEASFIYDPSNIDRIGFGDFANDYFVSDLRFVDGKLICEKTPVSDYHKISDLEGIILDVSLSNEGVLSVTRFSSNYSDEEILEGDEILFDDVIELSNAITDIYMNNTKLIVKRESLDIY